MDRQWLIGKILLSIEKFSRDHHEFASWIDFIAVTGTMDGRVIEFVDHLHEHFEEPVAIRRGR